MDKHEQILDKIVQAARARGWDDSELEALFERSSHSLGVNYMRRAMAHSPHSLIFRHDFAKAFFGENRMLEEYPLSDRSGDYLKIWMPAWQAHLRKMVLEPDPILYFEKYI
jgi:hypothetical protein